ncbi:unnamed protein product [Lota lota]
METVVGKHESLSQQRCHDICPGAEPGSGVFTNRPPADFRVQSPTDISSMFSSQASSRESVFSDGWDRERSWSAMQLSSATSPLSLSRAVSPCSSVRSGAFTPTVVRVRRHALATGSSMLHMPQASCLSSCESLASSVGPSLAPPPRRHRPPLTRLSLLTAILRKGRLPVLSPTLQRPYSPCWPINHITLASCTACSAASSLAPVSPQTALSPSLVCTEAPAEPQSRSHWDSFRRRPALPSVHIRDGYSSGRRLTETPALDHNYPTGKEPKFQTVFSRPVTSPVALRATGGEQGVALPHVPLPPLQSPTSQLKAVTANGANLTEPDEAQTKLKQPSPQTTGTGNISARRVCSPPPLPATARLDCISPQPRSLQSCLKKQPFASDSHSELPKHPSTKSPVLGNTSVPGPTLLDSPRDKISSPPRSSCLSPSRYTPIVFPGWPSPNSSRTSTPDRFTLTPSPASQACDLTPCPSPSPSLRSTPSPRPGSGRSECTYREGKKRKPHKIKSSYKSLAAIPTNTLLLDQQVIDKQVERVDDPSGTGGVEDPHAKMCSPAQLRQESEELYAVIDKILEDGIPKVSNLRRPMGRETKYVSLSVICFNPPPSSLERMPAETQTKPGVIRPMIAIPRLQVEDYGGNQCNPFARYLVDTPAARSSTSELMTLRNKEDGSLGSKSQTVNEGGCLEDARMTSASALLIMESEGRSPHPVKPASWQGASTTFSCAEVLPEDSVTRI